MRSKLAPASRLNIESPREICDLGSALLFSSFNQYSVCRQLRLGVAYQNAPLKGNLMNCVISKRLPSLSWSCVKATASAFKPISSQGKTASSRLMRCGADAGRALSRVLGLGWQFPSSRLTAQDSSICRDHRNNGLPRSTAKQSRIRPTPPLAWSSDYCLRQFAAFRESATISIIHPQPFV